MTQISSEPGQYPPEVEADRAHLDVETIDISALEVIALHTVVVLEMADDGLDGRSSLQFGLHVRVEPLAPRHINFPGRRCLAPSLRIGAKPGLLVIAIDDRGNPPRDGCAGGRARNVHGALDIGNTSPQ